MIHVDHQALQFLFQGPAKAECTCQKSKLIHWAERLSAFDYAVEHVKGSSNQLGNPLSHLPLESPESALLELTKDITLKRIARMIQFSSRSSHLWPLSCQGPSAS